MAVTLLAATVMISAGFQAGRVLSRRAALHSSNLSSFGASGGTWVVSSDPGPNVPPIGRSLFDFLTMVDAGGGQKKQVIPYPFSQLTSLIQSRLRPESQTPGYGLKKVLIPLGRSLQRSASAPDFFRFPRAVVGVDGFPIQNGNGTGMFMRDRLYVGYNEKASVLEVISYNEAAGRYEYQVAHDYRAGGNPQIVYANRSICLSCHQNATPIFSERPWQETNANTDISSRLLAAMAGAPASVFDGANYMGMPITVTESQPQGIDNTKFRANLIPVTHFLWQKLCEVVDSTPLGSAQCRARALSLALRMGFTNSLDENSSLYSMTDVTQFLGTLSAAWNKQWSAGLLISSPQIPNRNPFEKPRDPNPFDVSTLKSDVANQLSDLVKGSNIPAEFEPLNKRPPMDQWNAGPDNVTGLANWLRQITGFFTDLDWGRIDQWASAKAVAANARVQVSGACDANAQTNGKVSFTCDGGGSGDPLRVAGYVSWDSSGKASGALDTLAVRMSASCDVSEGADQDPCPEARNLVLRGQITMTADGVYQATFTSTNRINGQRSRFSDGNLLESVNLRWKAGTQVAISANVLRDFSYIDQALMQAAQDTASGQSTVFAKRPFRRTATMQALRAALTGVTSDAGDCCEVDTGMPAARADDESSTSDTALRGIVGPAAPFMKVCAVCHRNNSGFPPNYLTGSLLDVQNQLGQCVDRIWYRINMYDQPVAARQVSPMPPASRLNALGIPEDQWRKGPDLQALRDAVKEIMKSQGRVPPDPTTVDYKSLPPCFH